MRIDSGDRLDPSSDRSSSRLVSAGVVRIRGLGAGDGVVAVDPAAEVDQPAASEQKGKHGRSSSVGDLVRLARRSGSAPGS